MSHDNARHKRAAKRANYYGSCYEWTGSINSSANTDDSVNEGYNIELVMQKVGVSVVNAPTSQTCNKTKRSIEFFSSEHLPIMPVLPS